jgi:hypothetical protein
MHFYFKAFPLISVEQIPIVTNLKIKKPRQLEGRCTITLLQPLTINLVLEISNLYYTQNLFFATHIYHTITSDSLLFFSDASLLVCIKPN